MSYTSFGGFSVKLDKIEQMGPTATLIERDNDIPPFDVLLAEVNLADSYLVEAGGQRE